MLGKPFVVKTDNIATSYFATQPKLSPKQARWQDFLAEFDMILEYRPGRLNAAADALSRKAQLATVSGQSLEPMVQVVSDLRLRIRETLREDPTAISIFAQIKKRETTRFKEKDGLL